MPLSRGIGFYTLLRRETYRFFRLFRQTIVPPLMTTLLYILIFGYSLGGHIKQVKGFDFIVFILPGLAQLGIITNAYANSSTSLFMARLERSIENVLIAPLSYLHIVLAFILGSVFRGLTVGYATLLIARFFMEFPMPHPFLLLASWSLSCVFFGALGVASALIAESWDHISLFTNFVITA
jgi:ABC-2 type transport system permease protein